MTLAQEQRWREVCPLAPCLSLMKGCFQDMEWIGYFWLAHPAATLVPLARKTTTIKQKQTKAPGDEF